MSGPRVQHMASPWSNVVTDCIITVRTTLLSSWANILLVFVPLGIIADALDWSDAATFILNFLAIFALASVLSFATDQLSARVGQTIGGLVNATFGNAVELIVSCPSY
jgi:Ca2+:H+ antiporter